MDAELEEQTETLLGPSPESLAAVRVFPLIPHLRKDVITDVDSALSWDQLTASDINFALIRPLVFKYARLKNPACIYACLVVRSHFLARAREDLAYSGLMLSRANACEILAMKLLATFSAPSPTHSQLPLAAVLTTSWSPLQHAPPAVLAALDLDGADPECALELAIATNSKNLLSSPLVQAVVADIYTGRIVFSMASTKSVLADNYKPRAIELYDSRRAPFLDHYRLRVPRYGAILEFFNFALLLCTFVLCLSNRDMEQIQLSELVFIVFAIAFALEEYTASMEHGWQVYIANMWNVFDTSFIALFLAYLGLRLHGLRKHDPSYSELGFDILSCGACILFPRLAFFAISNNLVVIALRGMMAEFAFFMGIAAICFSGLLYTLCTLAGDRWTVKNIMWLMVQIWFGNTYLSFSQAASFHPIFGPILMTGFAALSGTLLLTILISILSNTFARIDANANQEYLFQFAITTIEGVKSDALFSYQPPFNLVAFAVLWPASFVLSPRTLHSLNVLLIKLTSFPTLVAIGVYERHLRAGMRVRAAGEYGARSLYQSLPRRIRGLPVLDALMGSDTADLYEAIFELDLDAEADPTLFAEQEYVRPALHSIASAEDVFRASAEYYNSGGGSRDIDGDGSGRGREAGLLFPRTKSASPRRSAASTPGSPRRRPVSLRPVSAEPPEARGQPSPLSRLFAGARGPRAVSESAPAVSMNPQVEASVRRVEALLEDVKEMPVQRLREEMKELQERQARIENLLLMLTRGMRNEMGTHSTIRHDTK